jgi:hypothetical protein
MVETLVVYVDDFYRNVVYLWYNIEEQQVFGWAWGIHKPYKYGRMSVMAEIQNEDRDELVYNMHNGKPFEVHQAVKDESPDKYNPENLLHTFRRMSIIIDSVGKETSVIQLSLSRPEKGK